MSTTAESRVVEMRFDNQQFEANAKETLNTLDQLKRALEQNISGDAFDQLDRAARNVDLSGIEAGIEALTDRFSTLGIVGMSVIQNITNALTNTLGRAVSNFTDSIVSGGLRRAQNIENARFQLQGILDTAEEVTEVMKNASDSVDGTAYALDAAANAASQLAASGVEAGEQMTNVLRGIAGVAATTSSDYEGISRIFTQIAGNGRVMGDQLLQLSNRGLNAAAELTKYINGVKNESIEASDAVKEQIAALTGATGLIQDASSAISDAAESSYDTAKKAADKEYKLKKKTYDAEYKALQKSLNNEYNLKKEAYDAEYKELQKALNAELQAVQEANSKRIEELNEKYQADVEAYREATDQKIALINEEYTESIKLIDEEKYNKLKAVQDQIDAINAQAKAEQKALKDQANAEKKAELESILSKAKSNKTKKQAAQVLADFEAELAREQLAEDRANQIEELQNQKTAINEEAQKKKEEAQKKAQSAKEAVQTESNAELKAMQKAHQEELAQLRKQQNEEVEALRESNSAKLQALKDSQNEQLSVYKEGQNEQLEVFREKQNEELELFKENQNEMLETLKSSSGKASKYAAKFGGLMDLTEADIREMVSDGLISFDLFSEAMATTFGKHAYDANKTFSGAMSNIKAALARTGAMFYTPLIAEGGPAVDLLNAIRLKINELNSALQPFAGFITTWLNYTVIPKITEFVNTISFEALPSLYSIRNIMDSIGNVGKFLGSIIGVVVDAFKDLFTIDVGSFSEATLQLKMFTSDLKVSTDASSKLSRFLKSIVKLFKSLWTVVKKVVKVFTPLTKLFGVASTDVSKMGDGVTGVIERFADWLVESEKLNKVFELLTKGMELFVNAIIKVRDKVSELSTRFKNSDIGQAFAKGFVEGMKAVASEVWSAITEFCTTVIDKIKSLFGIHSPSTVMFEIGVNVIKGLIEGIVSLTKNAISTITDLFTKIKEAIQNAFSDLNWTELFKDGLEASTNFVTQFAENIRDGIPNAIEAITDFFSGIREFITNRKDGEDAGLGFGNSFIEGIKNFGLSIGTKIKNVFKPIFEKIHITFDANSIKEGLANGGTYVVSFFTGIKDKLGDYVGKAGEWFKSFFENINISGFAALAAGAGAALGGLILLLKNLDLASLMKTFRLSKSIFKIVTLITQNMEAITSSEKFQELMAKFHLEGVDTALNFVAGFVNGLKDKIPDVLGTVKEFCLKLLDKIKNVLGIHSPSEETKKLGEQTGEGFWVGFKNKFEEIKEKIAESIKGLLDRIKELFQDHKDDLPAIGAIVGGIAAFGGIILLAKQLKTAINPLQSLNLTLGKIRGALMAYQMDLKADALLKVAEAIAILSASILGLYEVTKDDEEEKIKRLYIIAGLIGGIAIAFTVALGLLSKMSSRAKTEADAWFQAAKGVKKALGAWGMSKILEGFGNAVLKISIALAILAKMYASYPDATSNATKIILGIAVAAAIFAVASSFISKKTGEANTKLQTSATAFLYIAAAMFTIINAIQKIVDMNFTLETHGQALALVVGILILLTAIAIALGKLNNSTDENLSLSTSSILGFCILLYATINALGKAMELLKEENLTKEKIGIFAGIFIAVAVLIAIMGKASSKSQGLVGAFGALIGACAVIIVAIGAMQILANMPLEQIRRGLIVVGVLLLLVGVTLGMAAGIGSATSEGYKSVLAIAATLSLIVAALGIFAFFDTKKLLGSAASIAIVLIALAVCFASMSELGDTGKSKTAIIGMIIVLLEIAGSLYLLAKYDWKSLLAAGGAMFLTIIAFGACMKLIASEVFDVKDMGAFLLGSLSIIVIATALLIAASQPWSSLLAAAVGISASILAYAGAFKLFSSIEKISLENVGMFILGTLSMIIVAIALAIAASQPWDSLLAAGGAISGVLLAYAESFKLFGNAVIDLEDVGNYILGTLSIIIVSIALAIAASQPWDNLLGAGTAIAEVLTLYATSMLIFSKANVTMDDIANYLLGCIAVIGVGIILKEAAEEDWKSLLAAGISISVVLIAMAVSMLIASAAGNFSEAAIKGIGLLDAFIADLVVVLGVLGGLSAIPGFNEIIANGGELLVSVGTALGNFVGSIVGGVLESISDTFPNIGTNLAKFMKNAEPFLDGLERIKPEMVDAAGALAGIMLAIGVAELLDSFDIIGNVLSLFTPSLGDKFAGLGDALVSFATKTEGVNAYKAKAAAEACVAMVSVMDEIKGRDFRDAEGLYDFGTNIADFATTCNDVIGALGKNIDLTIYETASSIMKTMIGVVNECTNRDFRDGEQLPEFGNDLVDFAYDLRAVQSYAKDLIVSNFENLYNSAKWALQIADLIPRQQDSTSFVGVFAGSNDIGEFGDKLKQFASGIWNVADGMKERVLSSAQFKNLYDCTYWVLEIANAVPGAKTGIAALFGGGDNDLGNFGSKLETFVTSLQTIQTNLGTNGLNVSVFENIKQSAKRMIDIADSLRTVAESDKNYNVGTTLKNFGGNLVDFGKSIKKFGNKANEGYLGFSGAIELLQKFVPMIPSLTSFDGSKLSTFFSDMQTKGVKGLTNFLDAYSNSSEAVTTAIGTLFSNISQQFNAKKDLMEGYGRIIMGYFKNGIQSDGAINNVKEGIRTLLSKASEGARDNDSMRRAGEYAVEGFVRGIRDKMRDARDVGRELGNAAYDAARKALDEHSPSRKMGEVGSFAGEGFVNGLLEWVKTASQTGAEVGDSAREGLTDALSKLSSEIQNEDDFNPVITPVLDLSNVEANANRLGGILDLNTPLQLAANAGMSFTGGLNNLLSNIQASIPDNTNDDVVSSLNGLREDLNILSTRVANLQVVMDSGELVGVLTDPIDQQLGFNSVLNARGVRR